MFEINKTFNNALKIIPIKRFQDHINIFKLLNI